MMSNHVTKNVCISEESFHNIYSVRKLPEFFHQSVDQADGEMVLVSPWRRTDFIQRYGLYTLQTAVQLLSSCTPRTSVHLFLFQLDKTAQKVSLSWRDNCLLCCHLNFNILHLYRCWIK